MTIRTTMTDLVSRVRAMIHDPAGDSAALDDDTIQEALDARRIDVIGLPLYAAPELIDGEFVWRSYGAPYKDWESDAVLRDGEGDELSPSSSDLQTGRWTFADGQDPPVYLTGQSYDLYGASADLLDMRCAMTAEAFDFSADGSRFDRSQVNKAWTNLAGQYRARSRPVSGVQVRSDIA